MKNFFWDSCVIAAFLNEEWADADISSLNQFVQDAKAGDCKIYVSSITIAEILPSYLKEKKITSYQRFLKDMEGAIVQISPSPNILAFAARLRDIKYFKTVTKKEKAERKIDVPDAIMLATGVLLSDAYGVNLDAFHTYDNGKKRSVDGGKCVPLLGFAEWCAHVPKGKRPIVQKVISMNRTKPLHPMPGFVGV